MGARSGGATPYEAFGGWLYWLLERIWRLILPFTQKRWNKKNRPYRGRFLIAVRLLNNAAGETTAATAERSRVFGVIITTDVDDKRMPLDLIQRFQAWRKNGDIGVTIGINIQHGQIAKVRVVFPWLTVAIGVVRIPMTTRGEAENSFTVFFASVTTRMLMNMETVQPGGQAVQLRGENEAVFAFTNDDIARGLVAVQHLDGDRKGFVCGFGRAVIVSLRESDGAEGESEQGLFHGLLRLMEIQQRSGTCATTAAVILPS